MFQPQDAGSQDQVTLTWGCVWERGSRARALSFQCVCTSTMCLGTSTRDRLRAAGKSTSLPIESCPSACQAERPTGPQALTFKISQAGSVVFLAAAIHSFPSGVDPAYALGAYFNLVISCYHHGFMVKNRPDYQSSVGVNFSCSDVDLSRPWLRALRVVDRALVCFICLYTGCIGLGVSSWIVVLVCILSAAGGIPLVALVIGTSLCLTLPQLSGLSGFQQALFCAASSVGPVVFFHVEKLGGWCFHYRYLWHLCCACLVSIGGVLHSKQA
jgi:hypothetical protein